MNKKKDKQLRVYNLGFRVNKDELEKLQKIRSITKKSYRELLVEAIDKYQYIL